jgi:hypothetical protein
MRFQHDTFARPGGYKCINRDCPESPLFRYKTVKGDIYRAVDRGVKVKTIVSNND